jgi:hypothetical protein
LAGPYLNFVEIVNDIVIWLEAAMMKILFLVDTRIIVVSKVASPYACPRICPGHMVE